MDAHTGLVRDEAQRQLCTLIPNRKRKSSDSGVGLRMLKAAHSWGCYGRPQDLGCRMILLGRQNG